MREVVDHRRAELVMLALAAAADRDARVYFTGGVTAVLMGWRSSTVDVDMTVVPEAGNILRSIPALKEALSVNVEFADPSLFIPVAPGWEDRSVFVAQHGRVRFYHFDLYAQALAKVERGHARDRADVAAMLERGLIDPTRAREYFASMEPELYRFPAIDPPAFRRAVDEVFRARS